MDSSAATSIHPTPIQRRLIFRVAVFLLMLVTYAGIIGLSLTILRAEIRNSPASAPLWETCFFFIQLIMLGIPFFTMYASRKRKLRPPAPRKRTYPLGL